VCRTDAEGEAVGESPQNDDDRRRWWLDEDVVRRLRRNGEQLHVHMRFGRRATDIQDAGANANGIGKQFKQFLRFGR